MVRGNKVYNAEGDGIFPQTNDLGVSCENISIDNNYLENITDTAIDITSGNLEKPHEAITASTNVIVDGSIRISCAKDVLICQNSIANGHIEADNGAGDTTNITVEANLVVANSGSAAIIFLGAVDSMGNDNEVHGGTVGISAAIWGTGILENNTIYDATDYGIDFASWGLGGGTNMTISNNTIQNFGTIGIYDDSQPVSAIIENNTILNINSQVYPTYGIRTDYSNNTWIIRYNHVSAGSIAQISAPSSLVYGNN
jgi:hypothetical protein